MQWKNPKNTDKYYWTAHVAEKMHYYGLSQQKVLGVIRRPQRIETGIAENTVAVMMPVGNIKKNKPSNPAFAKASAWRGWNCSFNDDGEQQKWSQEIWVLYQIREQKSKNSDQKKLETQIKKLESKGKANKLMKLIPKKLVIISAWRYPGVSPKKNPIPTEIMQELEEIGLK